MSADNMSDKAKSRLRRLKAMQDKHPQPQPAEGPAATPSPAKGPGLLDGLRAAKAGGGEGGRAAMLQKLRQALSGPDGKIDQQKARMFLMFVRKQAADPEAPRHELAKRITEVLKNLPQQQRQRLMAVAGLGGMGLGGAGLGGAGRPNRAAGARKVGAAAQEAAGAPQDGPAPTGEAWFDDLVGKL